MFLMVGCVCNAQLWTITVRNTDRVTHRKVDGMIADLALIATANFNMESELRSARTNKNEQMQRDYTANPYDRENNMITNWFGSVNAIATGLAGQGLAANNTPYFTANKKKYVDAAAFGAVEMALMQNISKTSIRTSDRQALYRIRRDIIREHSKNQRFSRRLMMISAASLALMYDDPALLTFLRTGEIAF